MSTQELGPDSPVEISSGNRRGLSLSMGTLVAVIALLLGIAGQWWTQKANAEAMATAITDIKKAAETNNAAIYKAIADSNAQTAAAADEKLKAFTAQVAAEDKYRTLQREVTEKQIVALELTAAQLKDTPAQVAAVSSRVQRLETALDTIPKMQLQMNSVELHIKSLLESQTETRRAVADLSKPKS